MFRKNIEHCINATRGLSVTINSLQVARKKLTPRVSPSKVTQGSIGYLWYGMVWYGIVEFNVPLNTV